ncbi:helix-turn-helix domain-containing protein [Pseudactinotalea sp. Z1748]|uniref:helix-turn-helix domain-containing protein n=1 Tax=Pseudactinotalea sp. Z1748 TaxID=3413027 RepID=UPI003C7CA66B
MWTCRSEQVTSMTAVASETWGLVFWDEDGTPRAAVVGPESRTATAPVPPDTSFVGVQFALGASLRMADMTTLVDGSIPLPEVSTKTFWLDGRGWQIPGADDVELFVDRLVRHGALVQDPVVTEVLSGDRPPLSPRTVERRFRAATGMTRGAVRQIGRVRTAAGMLTGGACVADVVARLAYYDEPHLARALRRLIGRTAQELRSGTGGAIALDPAQYSTS